MQNKEHEKFDFFSDPPFPPFPPFPQDTSSFVLSEPKQKNFELKEETSNKRKGQNSVRTINRVLKVLLKKPLPIQPDENDLRLILVSIRQV